MDKYIGFESTISAHAVLLELLFTLCIISMVYVWFLFVIFIYLEYTFLYGVNMIECNTLKVLFLLYDLFYFSFKIISKQSAINSRDKEPKTIFDILHSAHGIPNPFACAEIGI